MGAFQNWLVVLLMSLGAVISANGAEQKQVQVRYLHIKSDIQSRFATTLVVSRLANANEQAEEVTFNARLPDAAFISNFTMQIGDKIIVGDVKEKEEAKLAYDQAKKRGESAGLVAKNPRETNAFTISTNVAAHGKITFNLTYQEILKRVHGAYKHVINLQSDNLDKSSDVEIDVRIIEQGKIVNVSVPKFGEKIGEKTNSELLTAEQEPNAAVSSVTAGSVSTTEIVYKPKPDQIESSNGSLAGQLVVLYDVERDLSGGQVQVVNGYFVHFFAPKGLAKGRKHVVFVLDKSGSMTGRKFSQTQAAMKRILSDLNSEDMFNIIMFDHGFQRWKTESLLATSANVQDGIDYVMASKADSSTNIFDPLVNALQLLNSTQSMPDILASMIVFMTDGQPNAGTVYKPDEIVSQITDMNRNSKHIIHSIAFGNDADFKLVQRLSSNNYGLARKVYEDSDADVQLTGFYAEISSPLLTDVQIEYLNETVDVSTIVQDQSYNYYDGGELVVLGKLEDHAPRLVTFDASVRGLGARGPVSLKSQAQTFVCPPEPIITEGDDEEPCCEYPRCGGEERFRIPARPRPILMTTTARPIPAPSSVGGFVERMWAYETIKKLLKEAQLGENGNATEKRQEALKLSLKYHFVTEMTSMVVVQSDSSNATALEKVSAALRPFGGYPGMPGPPGTAALTYQMHYSAGSFVRSRASGGSIANALMAPPQPMPPAHRSTIPPFAATTTTFPSTPVPCNTITPDMCDIELLIVSVLGRPVVADAAPANDSMDFARMINRSIDIARNTSQVFRVNLVVLDRSQSPQMWTRAGDWRVIVREEASIQNGPLVEDQVATILAKERPTGQQFIGIESAVDTIGGSGRCQKRQLVWITESDDAVAGDARQFLIRDGYEIAV